MNLNSRTSLIRTSKEEIEHNYTHYRKMSLFWIKELYKVWYLWTYRTLRNTDVSVFIEVYVIIVQVLEVQNAWSFGILESIVRKIVVSNLYGGVRYYSGDREVLYPWPYTEVRITEVSVRIMDVLSFASD